MNTIDPAHFRQAMGRTASGVTVVTSDGEHGRVGVTVSSLCSLSMEPPSVLFCLHRGSRSLPVLLGNGVFAANILAQGQQRVADSFAGLIPELRDDRFAAGTWDHLHTGAPLLQGALCRFDCRIASVFEFGTHSIIAGEVMALETHGIDPLVYSDRSYRRLHAA
ncbi:flavin reductase family protein [Ancylobacter pratisalsi]|uniref:Flavin reductase family protein n=1 Tax=Ancylobacter pratisalsi TaxID=1745854 RepID=A0A6P1YQ07_9HYPH|nr:flavin reductase family protein [Ancylobacter pratisalsi]QIB34990.1 flavin reductase family protein [Ancylobacter pratisalsi]